MPGLLPLDLGGRALLELGGNVVLPAQLAKRQGLGLVEAAAEIAGDGTDDQPPFFRAISPESR
ncbi:hypothetical protein [Bosea sp. TND4EK4]|uniref:hypothetical protein n=1 Tax=Bosea sp. TND4EK4 TaxID=1907408 RepID=UPI000970233A|nr:hypothetical protein [Bosea sp. TND4EK4]